jgi:hypothetical protein
MKKKLLFTLCAMFVLTFVSNAQPPDPNDPGGGGDPNDSCFPPPCVPIDGGLSWLLIAGTVYGGKKLYKANKEQKEEL